MPVFNDLTIATALGLNGYGKPKAGEVYTGVEIELEDWVCDADIDVLRGVWVEHPEGSLRNGREFVLHPPLQGESVVKAVDKFFNLKARWNPSERASVHVHLDMTNGYTVSQFRALFALTYGIEAAIYRFADENRKWASYSCPLIDMRFDRMAGILTAKDTGNFKRALVGAYHEEKYYGFNAVSLTKHGTIELRYFPCTTDKKTLLDWIKLCQELYFAAKAIGSIADLHNTIRDMGVVRFLRHYMPESADRLIPYIDENDTLQRIAQCWATTADPNAGRFPEAEIGALPKNSKAFNRMVEIVCAEALKKRRLIEEHDAVEVPVDRLYAKLLEEIRVGKAHNIV